MAVYRLGIDFETAKRLMKGGPMPRRLILRSLQSPGDVVMLTAAVRDLHAACPGQFETDVRSSAPALWEHRRLMNYPG